jgi:hypothetical protein
MRKAGTGGERTALKSRTKSKRSSFSARASIRLDAVERKLVG